MNVNAEKSGSVPTESRPELDAGMDWAYRAAERIHLLYRDANYFKSMPKVPLIEGWAEIICTEFFKSPPVMFGFKTVEDWEKFTKFAASSVLLPVPPFFPKRAEDMEGLIGAVWAAHDEWKRLDARNQLSGECDYAEWLADAVLNHLRAGLPVGESTREK